jgi:tRNA threonylcarbamoyladenosine biosynthesis protein TsaE
MYRDEQGTVFRSVELSDLGEVAKYIAMQLETYRVWLFYGEMGAGKTTLIKEICKAAGVADAMSSPTFSIVNEYETPARQRIFHFDFYRIRNEGEAYDIGADEYFYSGSVCFVEWPEKVPSLIPARHVDVAIDAENNTQRTIAISFHDGEEENRV